MDSLTHIALGACVGEAFFKKGVGKKVMFWGALAQSVPDIDFIASFWMTTPDSLLAHRGFTHSVLFALLIIPVLALVANRIHRSHNIGMRTWLIFFAIEVLLHLFIDGYNNYGIGWLEPFSHYRYSLNAIYVADPFFSVWPVIAFFVLIFLNRYSPRRTFWWKTGIIIPFIYLGYCTVNKVIISTEVKKILTEEKVPDERFFITPAPLQNWLWYVVSGNDAGYYVGFRSLFDSKGKIDFEYFPRNDSLLKLYADQEELQKLIRFSKGFYTVERWGDTLVFNDLRFGQIAGWENPRGRFAFHYYLQYPYKNKMVVQRGRFSGWNRRVVHSFFKRIWGK